MHTLDGVSAPEDEVEPGPHLLDLLNGQAEDGELEYLPCALPSAIAAPLQALLNRLLPEAERDFCSSSSDSYADARDLPPPGMDLEALVRAQIDACAARGKCAQ